MTRKAVVCIGYREFSMSLSDATIILKIAERAEEVERARDGDQMDLYHPVQDARPFATHMQFSEVGKKTKPKVIPKSHRLTHDKVTKS